MFSLPRNAHRYFIEPLSTTPHIKTSLIKRFLRFTDRLSQSKKIIARNLYSHIRYDCQSTTGNNLRNIMLFTNQDVYNTVDWKNLSKPYISIPQCELWRIDAAKELIDLKYGILHVSEFSKEELDDILEYIRCT